MSVIPSITPAVLEGYLCLYPWVCPWCMQTGIQTEQPAIGRLMIVKTYFCKTASDSAPIMSSR